MQEILSGSSGCPKAHIMSETFHKKGTDVAASPKSNSKDEPEDGERNAPIIGSQSPGVARIEALNAHTSLANRCCIFFSLFLIAYAYGLDGTLRYTYQPYATSGFSTHSTLATIGVLRSIIAAAAQPAAAKIGMLKSFSSLTAYLPLPS